ncbi:hypothetical protein ACHAXT_003127 [Thalassiosira profunda]
MDSNGGEADVGCASAANMCQTMTGGKRRGSGSSGGDEGDSVLCLRRCRTLLLICVNVFLMVSIARLWRTILGEGAGLMEGAQTQKEVNRSAYQRPNKGAGLTGGATKEVNRASYQRPDDAPLVAIVSCIASGVFQPAWFLEQTLLPSIYATITDKEREQYRVELFLGYDHDDAYWRGHDHHLSPKAKYSSETIYGDRETIPINFVSIKKDPTGDRPNRIPFNELCQSAYDYGASYIVRINDDSEFKTAGWISAATKELRKFTPPNVGVVGPTCHQGDTTIMTHDMVHVPSHFSIFDTYYPDVFDNYYVDDWITHVYGEKRTKQLGNWEIHHHTDTFSTRYKPTFHQDQLLNQTIKEGRELVEMAVLEKRNSDGEIPRQRDDLSVLGTDAIERVDGPMRDLHLSLMKKSAN